MTVNHDLSDSYSIMSTDSIEPHDSNEILNKSKIFHQYSPRRNFLNIWNTPKTSLIETNDTNMKDFLSVSPTINRRKQEYLVKIQSYSIFSYSILVHYRLEESI